MINLSKEFCWTVKKYYPLGISLILLQYVAEEFKFLLPSFLESGYLVIIQIVVSGLLLIEPIQYIKRIKPHVKKDLTKNGKIKFKILVMLALYGNLFVNVIVVNVFLLKLFSITYGIDDSNNIFGFSLQDIVIGFVVFPVIGSYSFWNIRKNYLTTKLEEEKCGGIICFGLKNWIWTSLFILIFLNFILIFCDCTLL